MKFGLFVEYFLFEVCWVDFRILFVLVIVAFLEIEWMCKKVVEDVEKIEEVLFCFQVCFFFTGFLLA